MQAFFANLQISINFNQSTALFMCKMMNFIKIWAHQLKIWLQAKGTDYIVRRKPSSTSSHKSFAKKFE